MKKRAQKLLSLLLVLVFVCALIPVPAASAEWEGYTAISTEADLKNIANDMSGKYYLTNDITLAGTWTPLGLGQPGHYTDEDFSGTPFRGTLDGNGHKIIGMNTGELTTYAGVGLFGATARGAVVKNLTLSNAKVYGRYWVGAFAGINNGRIENCHVVDSRIQGREGSVPTQDYNYVGGSQIGGIAGWNCTNGEIADCSVITTSVWGNRFVGGIAGANNGLIEKTFVRACAPGDTSADPDYWIGSKYYAKQYPSRSTAMTLHLNHHIARSQYSYVNGKYYFTYSANAPYMMVGGLVGSNDNGSQTGTGVVRNCYVTNTQINGIDGFGELMGANWGRVENCYTAENGITWYEGYPWYDSGANAYIYWEPDYAARNFNNASGGRYSGIHYYSNETYDSGCGTNHYQGANMKEQGTYTGWDFKTIWTLDPAKTAENYGYPVFGVTDPTPDAPTDDKIAELLPDYTVIVDCTNAYVNHADKSFGLLAGSYTKGEVTGSKETGYTCTITISPDKYIDAYNASFTAEASKTHAADPADQSAAVTFVYDTATQAWKLSDGTAQSATFTAICTEGPEAPTDDKIAELLPDYTVIVDCTNAYVNHADGTYGLLADSYIQGDVTGSKEAGYTCTITISPDKYVDAYNASFTAEASKTHVADPAGQSAAVTFVYDKDAQAWKLSDGTAQSVTFTVICTEGPEDPTDDGIADLLADYEVIVDCTSPYVSHADKSFDLLAGSYTKGEVTGSKETGYTCTITIAPDKYVEAYNDTFTTAASKTHAADPADQSATVTFVYDKDAQAWKLSDGAEKSATFTVVCTEGPEAPTGEHVHGLFGELFTVECTRENTTCESKTYDLLPGSYTIGDVTGSHEDGYTCTVTVYPEKYRDQYSEDSGKEHALDAESENKVLTMDLIWKEGAWRVDGELIPMTWGVVCSDSHDEYVWLHYESNGGTAFKSEAYLKNTTVKLEKTPVREGYTFTGWYEDAALTKRITEIYMCLDRIVYAGWEKTDVPGPLEGGEHFAYVTGYADGTVRPNAQITRAEVATIIFRLLKDEVRSQYLTTTNAFTDVNEGDWYNTAISTVAAMGIVNGRADGVFAPNEPITRAEFAAICARFAEQSGVTGENFTDISGHWAESEIKAAAALGWIDGYTDGTFRPNAQITRAEAMTLVNRVLQRIPQSTEDLLDGMHVWTDNTDPDVWYYLAVQEATNSHSYEKHDETFEKWLELKADPDWESYED